MQGGRGRDANSYTNINPNNDTTPDLPTNIVDFGGFDSSVILIERGGILMSKGDFPESLSQAMLVGVMLVGRLGVVILTSILVMILLLMMIIMAVMNYVLMMIIMAVINYSHRRLSAGCGFLAFLLSNRDPKVLDTKLLTTRTLRY